MKLPTREGVEAMIETILFRLVGFFAGVFPILLCVVFGPSPMYSYPAECDRPSRAGRAPGNSR